MWATSNADWASLADVFLPWGNYRGVVSCINPARRVKHRNLPLITPRSPSPTQRNLKTIRQLARLSDDKRRPLLSSLTEEQYRDVVNVMAIMPVVEISCKTEVSPFLWHPSPLPSAPASHCFYALLAIAHSTASTSSVSAHLSPPAPSRFLRFLIHPLHFFPPLFTLPHIPPPPLSRRPHVILIPSYKPPSIQNISPHQLITPANYFVDRLDWLIISSID